MKHFFLSGGHLHDHGHLPTSSAISDHGGHGHDSHGHEAEGLLHPVLETGHVDHDHKNDHPPTMDDHDGHSHHEHDHEDHNHGEEDKTQRRRLRVRKSKDSEAKLISEIGLSAMEEEEMEEPKVQINK